MHKVKKEISLNKVRNYSVITCFRVICEGITTAQLTEVRDYSKTLRNNHTSYLVFSTEEKSFILLAFSLHFYPTELALFYFSFT